MLTFNQIIFLAYVVIQTDYVAEPLTSCKSNLKLFCYLELLWRFSFVCFFLLYKHIWNEFISFGVCELYSSNLNLKCVLISKFQQSSNFSLDKIGFYSFFASYATLGLNRYFNIPNIKINKTLYILNIIFPS